MLTTLRRGAHRVLEWLRPIIQPQAAPLCGLPSITPTELHAIWQSVEPFTMTSIARVAALVRSVAYLEREGIPGDIVECGVWRGGSMMAVARALRRRRSFLRRLWLFDTYDGMTEPGPHDRDRAGYPALDWIAHANFRAPGWDRCPQHAVQRALVSTGYPPELLHFVEGKVEHTLPERAPKQIALLRLDTDWYTSTRHELEHLYPRLSPGGVLIVDDYGHWQGAQRAVDEYFATHGLAEPLHEIDYTARLVIKSHA